MFVTDVLVSDRVEDGPLSDQDQREGQIAVFYARRKLRHTFTDEKEKLSTSEFAGVPCGGWSRR